MESIAGTYSNCRTHQHGLRLPPAVRLLVQTFDDLGRVLTRTYPDAGVEKFGFAAAAMINYTNQLSLITRFGYHNVPSSYPGRRLSAYSIYIRIAIGLVSVAFLYCLSIGPAYSLYAKRGASQSGFLSLYEPLISLRDRSPAPIAAVFDSYMRLWYDYRSHSPAKAK